MSNTEFSDLWDSTRNRFRSSMMLNTELHKLAQNIDASWPIRGTDETPEKYISLTYEELQLMPEIAGRHERIELLISIMEETLAFDDPFGEMVEYVDSSSKKDESAIQSLEGLGVPIDFPISLTHLSEDTKDFCQGEDIKDLSEFISFSQNMAQNVVVGGDFKRLLNSLTHLDESVIREYVPQRKGEHGIYLAESLGLLAKDLLPHEQEYLLNLFGLTSTNSETKSARPLGKLEFERLSSTLEKETHLRFEYFKSDGKTLINLMKTKDKRTQGRFFVSINDSQIEQVAWTIANLVILGHPDSKKKSLFKKLFKR